MNFDAGEKKRMLSGRLKRYMYKFFPDILKTVLICFDKYAAWFYHIKVQNSTPHYWALGDPAKFSRRAL